MKYENKMMKTLIEQEREVTEEDVDALLTRWEAILNEMKEKDTYNHEPKEQEIC